MLKIWQRWGVFASHDHILLKDQIGATGGEALTHVGNNSGRIKADLNFLVRLLAEAKGLPKRVGEKQAQEFFAVNQI